VVPVVLRVKDGVPGLPRDRAKGLLQMDKDRHRASARPLDMIRPLAMALLLLVTAHLPVRDRQQARVCRTKDRRQDTDHLQPGYILRRQDHRCSQA